MKFPRWLLLFAPALIACASTAPRSASRSSEAEVLTYDARVEAETLDEMRIVFPWELKNGAGSTAVVERIVWKLEIEGQAQVAGTEAPALRVGAGKAGRGGIDAVATFATTEEAFAERADKRVLTYTALATFTVSVGGAAEDYEAEWNDEIFAPKRPALELRPQAARYEETVELNARLVVNNPNSFSVTLDEIEAVIFVLDTEVYRGTVGTDTRLQPSSETTFDVNRWIGRDDLHELAKSMRKMKTVPYRVEALLRIDGEAMASRLQGEITFPR